MIERVTLLNLTFLPDQDESRIKATASISVDSIKFFSIQIIQKNGKPPFIPFRAWKFYEPNGHFLFRRYFRLPASLEKEIENLILMEFQSQLQLKKTDSDRDGRNR